MTLENVGGVNLPPCNCATVSQTIWLYTSVLTISHLRVYDHGPHATCVRTEACFSSMIKESKVVAPMEIQKDPI